MSTPHAWKKRIIGAFKICVAMFLGLVLFMSRDKIGPACNLAEFLVEAMIWQSGVRGFPNDRYDTVDELYHLGVGSAGDFIYTLHRRDIDGDTTILKLHASSIFCELQWIDDDDLKFALLVDSQAVVGQPLAQIGPIHMTYDIHRQSQPGPFPSFYDLQLPQQFPSQHPRPQPKIPILTVADDPADMNFAQVHAAGQDVAAKPEDQKRQALDERFLPGAPFDFQRDRETNAFQPEFMNATYYAVGVFGQGALMSEDEIVDFARAYAPDFSNGRIDPDLAETWARRGFEDAKAGRFNDRQ